MCVWRRGSLHHSAHHHPAKCEWQDHGGQNDGGGKEFEGIKEFKGSGHFACHPKSAFGAKRSRPKPKSFSNRLTRSQRRRLIPTTRSTGKCEHQLKGIEEFKGSRHFACHLRAALPKQERTANKLGGEGSAKAREPLGRAQVAERKPATPLAGVVPALLHYLLLFLSCETLSAQFTLPLWVNTR